MTCLPLVPLVCGAVALGRIRSSGGKTGGRRLAMAAMWLGAVQLVLFGGMVVGGWVVRAKRIAEFTQACDNMSSFGCLMFEFDQDWGSFPSLEVYEANREQFAGLQKSDDANFYLGMLIAGGYTESEEVIFAACPATKGKRPNNVTKPAARVLEAGECGFGYVMLRGGTAQSTSDVPGRLLLVTPLALDGGGSDPRFDRASMGGKAAMLRLDQAVYQVEVDRNGRVDPGEESWHRPPKGLGRSVSVGKGHPPFATGPNTVWGDDAPEVKAPRAR